MKERRRFARFNIKLPVRMEAVTSDKREVLDLKTKNISYSGTFIPTLTSFPEGTRFVLDFTVPTDNLEDFKDIKSLKECMGRLVRSAPHGLAIQFDTECQIKGLKAL